MSFSILTLNELLIRTSIRKKIYENAPPQRKKWYRIFYKEIL